MSLVDYAASSDEDDDFPHPDDGDLPPVEGEAEERQEALPAKSAPSTRKPSPPWGDRLDNPRGLPPPSFEKLPDASLLLNDPARSSSLYSGSDHASRVAAAMAEGASRKREPPVLPSTATAPRNKVPRGKLLHTKSVPDTVGGVLLPPQLRGRSNVVTEDLGKLFVKRHTDPPSG